MAKKVIKKSARKGIKLTCRVCGLGVTVDSVCGCVDYCDIICCGQEMKAKK